MAFNKLSHWSVSAFLVHLLPGKLSVDSALSHNMVIPCAST